MPDSSHQRCPSCPTWSTSKRGCAPRSPANASPPRARAIRRCCGSWCTQPFPALLVGRRLESIDRRGHFMRFGLDGDLVIVVNACWSGATSWSPPARGQAQEIRARSGWRWRSTGSPSCSTWTRSAWGRCTSRRPQTRRSAGLRPAGHRMMSPAFTREAFGKAAARRRDQVRAFLMDKRALASIGNAYADEILFAARPAPQDVLQQADARGGRRAVRGDRAGAARRDRRDPRRDEPIEVKVRDFLKVRGRDGKPCLVCGTTIRAVRVGDGDACFCPQLSARDPQAVRQLERSQRDSRKIAPAVATFSESAPADIGMVTRWSQASRAAADSPGPSAPSSSAKRGGGRKLGQRRRAGLDDGADEREPRRRAAPPDRRASGWRARWAA